MPLVVLVILCVLGYVVLCVLTGTVVAYEDNRKHDEAMDDSDAALLAFFSLFWPLLWVYGGVCVVAWCALHGVKGTYRAYWRYLRYLGVPKNEVPSA
jgi:hypothetical protein